MLRFFFFVLGACALVNAQINPQWQHWQATPAYTRFQPGYQPVDNLQYWYPSPTYSVGYNPPVAPTFYQANVPNQERKAIVKLVGQTVEGNVTFTQQQEGGPVQVEGVVTGLPAGLFGFHVHDKGDITGGCGSAGPHFNPYKKTHGAPQDEVRHVGDLGNIESDNNRIAHVSILDHVISLSGPNSIIGRALVVHAGQDDLGRTNHPDSKSTGNAGARAACGVIGILDIPNTATSLKTSLIFVVVTILALGKFF